MLGVGPEVVGPGVAVGSGGLGPSSQGRPVELQHVSCEVTEVIGSRGVVVSPTYQTGYIFGENQVLQPG